MSVENKSPLIEQIQSNIEGCFGKVHSIAVQIKRLEESINYPDDGLAKEDPTPKIDPPPMVQLSVRTNDLQEYLESLLERLTLANIRIMGE